MVNIRLDLAEMQDKIIKMYMAVHGLSDKRKAISEIIESFGEDNSYTKTIKEKQEQRKKRQ